MDRKPAARLIIADDHRLLAEACKHLLEYAIRRQMTSA